MGAIRAYRNEDLEQLLDIWHRASLVAHPFLDEEFLQDEAERIRAEYLPMAETWVYVRNEKLAGFIALIGREVGGLFVDPILHGQGIGRALVDYASTLRAELELDVFEANEIGRRFYERYGFKTVKRHFHDMTGHPLLRMRLPRKG